MRRLVDDESVRWNKRDKSDSSVGVVCWRAGWGSDARDDEGVVVETMVVMVLVWKSVWQFDLLC